MYVLIAREFKEEDGKRGMYGYFCRTDQGDIILKRTAEVKEDAGKGVTANACVDKAGRLRGKNCVLSELPCGYPENLLSEALYTGGRLSAYYRDHFAGFREKRSQYPAIREYLFGECREVLLLHGLRRTGKTVLMWQAAYEAGLKDGFFRVAVYILNDSFSICEVKRSVNKLIETIILSEGE